MKKLIIMAVLSLLAISANAQDPKSEKDREKEFFEAIQTQVDKLAETLDLDDWQIFYVDSILTHDYKAVQDEFKELNESKVGNSDIYYRVQDKWMEQIYQSFHKIFDETQWAKYLKTGAAREKKARDKRAEKYK